MLYLPYGLSDSGLQFYLKIKITIPKKKCFFLSPTHFFLHSVPPLPYLFHPSYLPSVFIQYFFPFPFSPSLSHFATSIPHVLNCLSLLIAHSAPSFLSFRPVPVFSFLVPTYKSHHHFSFFCTLSPQVLRNFLCHTPFILPVVSAVSLFSLSSTFIHLFFALNLSTFSLAYPFL
jgi:hypothetical protein